MEATSAWGAVFEKGDAGRFTGDVWRRSGPAAVDGLVWATGHYRNGILLTPVTADLVADVLSGVSLPDFAAAADPLRFEGVLA